MVHAELDAGMVYGLCFRCGLRLYDACITSIPRVTNLCTGGVPYELCVVCGVRVVGDDTIGVEALLGYLWHTASEFSHEGRANYQTLAKEQVQYLISDGA